MLTLVRIVSLAFALIAVTGAAMAQSYPTKPIKIIVSTTPGGITDILARFLGAHITAKTGQAVVIDNRAGGSGNIAMSEVSRAAPDGYTLGFANTGNITINPYLFSKLNYDPLNDLVPIGPVGTVPLFLTVNASRMPATNLGVPRLRQGEHGQGQLRRRRRGHDTRPRAERIRAPLGPQARGVPHRGTGPATQAVIVGDVQVTFVSMGPHIELVRKGVLRVLAAATPKRMPYVPDVPTFSEQGFPGFTAETWFALLRRADAEGAPRAAQRLHPRRPGGAGDQPAAGRDLRRSAAADAGRVRRAGEGDAVKWERIVRESGAKLD